TLYNPGGEQVVTTLPVDDASQDFVFSTSLFTHLLERELGDYLRESFRVLRPGGVMRMSVFSIDHVAGKVKKRWKFEQRLDQAYVYDPQRPEAAVAYHADWLCQQARQAGFDNVELMPHTAQSDLLAFKPEGVAA
ncbi:MAG: methyltransferase domain-containing protein, partial [Rhodospirillales bacterium]|nr:methyltransferase domain-containing protein [Rhodospirillales bacterium]